jgi:hypothetical protein
MNLYGWSLASFRDVLGSKDPAVLESAMATLCESLQEGPALDRGKAWLRTLIESGYPFRQDRPEEPIPDDGGLLTVRMETEAHAFVVYSIAQTIRREEYLDLASKSSHWAHGALGASYGEMSACKFLPLAAGVDRRFFGLKMALSNGSPLFGDDFRTDWSFYSILTRDQLAILISAFRAAIAYTRPLPADYPEAMAKSVKTRLSDTAKEFLGDLITWFGRIEQAGQDAFILWW